MTDATPSTRPDLDELIGRVYYAAEWAFSSAPDALQEALWEAGAAIESERERADQAEQRIAHAKMAIMTWNINGATLSDLSRILSATS